MSRILRVAEVIARSGLSRGTIWRLEKDGKFPARVRLGGNSVGWREDEFVKWIGNLQRADPAARMTEAGEQMQEAGRGMAAHLTRNPK